jgi:hypothetical protein
VTSRAHTQHIDHALSRSCLRTISDSTATHGGAPLARACRQPVPVWAAVVGAATVCLITALVTVRVDRHTSRGPGAGRSSSPPSPPSPAPTPSTANASGLPLYATQYFQAPAGTGGGGPDCPIRVPPQTVSALFGAGADPNVSALVSGNAAVSAALANLTAELTKYESDYTREGFNGVPALSVVVSLGSSLILQIHAGRKVRICCAFRCGPLYHPRHPVGALPAAPPSTSPHAIGHTYIHTHTHAHTRTDAHTPTPTHSPLSLFRLAVMCTELT